MSQELTKARPAGCEAKLTLNSSFCLTQTLLVCQDGGTDYLRTETSYAGQDPSILLQTMDYRRIAEGVEGNLGLLGDVAASTPLPLETLSADTPTLVHDMQLQVVFMGLRRPSSFVGTARYEGDITLPTGEHVTKIALDLTQHLPAPMPPLPGGGSYFLDPVTGLAIEGPVKFDFGGGIGPYPVPLDLIRPGEAGFDEPQTISDCEVISDLSPKAQKVPA